MLCYTRLKTSSVQDCEFNHNLTKIFCFNNCNSIKIEQDQKQWLQQEQGPGKNRQVPNKFYRTASFNCLLEASLSVK